MSEISRLLVEQGRNAAEGARHSGEIWGNLTQQLGQLPATYGNLKWQAEQRAAGAQERDIAARQRADAEKEKATAKRQQQIGQQAQDMIRLGNMTPESVKALVDQSASEFEGDTPNVLRARLTTSEGAQQVAQFLSDRFGATPPGQKLTDHDPTKDLIDPTGRVVRPGVAASPKDRNPLVVKPGDIVLGPDNQPVYTAPNAEPKAAELKPEPTTIGAYTLPDGTTVRAALFSDGKYRKLATGEVITDEVTPVGKPDGEKPDTRSLDVQYVEAVRKGDTATAAALLKAKRDLDVAGAAGNVGPQPGYQWVTRNGQAVYTNRVQAGDTPASQREHGRPVTSGDANKIAEFTNSMSQLEELRHIIAPRDPKTGKLFEQGATGTTAAIGAGLPNFVTNAIGWNAPKQKQATIDRVKQVIGKSLEGGVLRKEDEIKYTKILPTIGDSVDVVETKLNGLRDAINQKRQDHLDSLGDAGYDTSAFTARVGGAPSTAKPSGKITVTAPDGSKHDFATQAQADAFKKLIAGGK